MTGPRRQKSAWKSQSRKIISPKQLTFIPRAAMINKKVYKDPSTLRGFDDGV